MKYRMIREWSDDEANFVFGFEEFIPDRDYTYTIGDSNTSHETIKAHWQRVITKPSKDWAYRMMARYKIKTIEEKK